MYADPAHIRKNRVNLSLNDAEDRLAEAMAEFNGMQKSVFLRELVLEGLSRFHSSHFCSVCYRNASYKLVTLARHFSNGRVTRNETQCQLHHKPGSPSTFRSEKPLHSMPMPQSMGLPVNKLPRSWHSRAWTSATASSSSRVGFCHFGGADGPL